MHALYIASVIVHILAAMTWVGGMIFLVLVVVPYLRTQDRAKAAALMRATGTRFRTIGWFCFALLIATGTFNLYVRGVRFESFVDAAWLDSPLGRAVVIKLSLVAVVLAISAAHDFWLGPRATIVVERDPTSDQAQRLRRSASMLGRFTALLALAIVSLGVFIVRGWPF